MLLSRLIVVSIPCLSFFTLLPLVLSHNIVCEHAILCKWFVSVRLFACRMHGNRQPKERALATHMHAYTKCHVSRWNAINAIAFRAIFTDYPNRNEWICIAAHAQHKHTCTWTQLMCAMADKVHSRFCISPFAHTAHTYSCTHNETWLFLAFISLAFLITRNAIAMLRFQNMNAIVALAQLSSAS